MGRIRWFPLLLFWVLACALSWVTWWPLMQYRLGQGPEASAFRHLLGSLGPAVAAFLMTFLLKGREAAGRLAQDALRWRVEGPWWWLSLGGLGLMLAGGLAGQWAMSGTAPAWSKLLVIPEFLGVPFILLVLAEVFFYGFGEEIGWRGYLWPRLRVHFPFWKAALIITVPWALWHLPLLLTTDAYRALSPALLGGWVLSLFTGSVLTGWLYERSDRSLPLVAVFHGLLDVAMVNGAVNQVGLALMGGLVTLWGIGVLLTAHSPTLRERRS